MIREWLNDQLILTRMNIRFLQARLSTFARDQFRQGYLAGYGRGHQDGSDGLPNVCLPYRSDPHPQVEVDGIEVDEEIMPLPDKFSPVPMTMLPRSCSPTSGRPTGS